jgi:hypothetical protein
MPTIIAIDPGTAGAACRLTDGAVDTLVVWRPLTAGLVVEAWRPGRPPFVASGLRHHAEVGVQVAAQVCRVGAAADAVVVDDVYVARRGGVVSGIDASLKLARMTGLVVAAVACREEAVPEYVLSSKWRSEALRPDEGQRADLKAATAAALALHHPGVAAFVDALDLGKGQREHVTDCLTLGLWRLGWRAPAKPRAKRPPKTRAAG